MDRGEIIAVDVTGVSAEGDGVARTAHEGFVIFVRGALPGERVKCRITKSSSTFARADTVEIVSPSDVRREPRCRHFGRCGGCRLQHASYGAQRAIKSRMVADALARIAKIDPGVVDCVASLKEWGYRSKTSLPVRSAGGKTICGYFEEGSHRIVPYDDCPVLTGSISQTLPQVIGAVRSCGLEPYDERAHSGKVRWIALRSGGLMDESAIACVVSASDLSKRDHGRLRDIMQKIAAASPQFVGASLNINPDRGNFIWGPRFRPIFGKASLQQTLGEFTFDSDISSFFQVNRAVAAVMFDHVRALLKGCGASNALELYSGVGALTAFAASAVEHLDAVEEWRRASSVIESNMERLGIEGVTAHACAAEAFAGEAAASGKRYDAVVLDPPRTGCPEAVSAALREIAPKDIIYVSCAPATLARDVARLAEDYELAGLRAFDMFPQTQHVETVVHLTRKARRS